MLETLFNFILAAHGSTATIYGLGEFRCGDIDRPTQCMKGAITSSGETFDPDIASMALALPNDILIRPTWVVIRIESGPCRAIRLNDRKNERYSHSDSRIDLTPAAVAVLGGKPSPHWSGRIWLCFPIRTPTGYDWSYKTAGFP